MVVVFREPVLLLAVYFATRVASVKASRGLATSVVIDFFDRGVVAGIGYRVLTVCADIRQNLIALKGSTAAETVVLDWLDSVRAARLETIYSGSKALDAVVSVRTVFGLEKSTALFFLAF